VNTVLDKIESQIARRADLTCSRISAMYELLTRHFDGVTERQFESDLLEKNWVILIERGDQLVGFSTLLVYETAHRGEPLSVVYSGDTIMAPDAWGTTALPRAWIHAVNALRPSSSGRYYWLLLTSGFRTYRFLPVFWREFYPRFDRATPEGVRGLVDQLAADRFGSQYSSGEGIVRFERPQRLRGELARVPSGRVADPHVAFFTRHNPGAAQGDELVCLTELKPENLTCAGRRMVNSEDISR
jgi:hypothetical protein